MDTCHRHLIHLQRRHRWQWFRLIVACLCFLVLHVTSAEASLICPRGCQCTDGGSGVMTFCLSTNYTSIPILDPTTEQFFMQNHHLGLLTKGSFRGLDKLKSVNLLSCGITEIERGAFESLVNLASLNLKGNNITKLEKGVFEGLNNLVDINFDSNELTSIENHAFEGVGSNVMIRFENNFRLKDIAPLAFEGAEVQELYFYNCSLSEQSLASISTLKESLSVFFLSNNNVQLDIPVDLFKGFFLVTLNLAQNGIHDISFLRHVTADKLSLEYNEINSMDFTRFPDMKDVRSLRLSHNFISSLNGSYFKNMESLSQLYLAHNQITTLPESLQSVFSQLDQLSLEGNPIHCNCEVTWFKNYMTITPKSKLTAPSCVTPKERPLKDVPNEDFVCLPPSDIKLSQHEDLTHNKLSLSCSAKGDPAPIIAWTLPGGNTIETPMSLDRNVKETEGVVDVNPSGGKYTCTSYNIAGNLSREAVIASFETQNAVVSTGVALWQLNVWVLITMLVIVARASF